MVKGPVEKIEGGQQDIFCRICGKKVSDSLMRKREVHNRCLSLWKKKKRGIQLKWYEDVREIEKKLENKSNSNDKQG